MATLGLWLGPTLAVLVGAAAAKLGWFRPWSRRRAARQRVAEGLAFLMANGDGFGSGSPHLYERYREHYSGGRDWQVEWDKANVYDAEKGIRDERGPASRWWEFWLR